MFCFFFNISFTLLGLSLFLLLLVIINDVVFYYWLFFFLLGLSLFLFSSVIFRLTALFFWVHLWQNNPLQFLSNIGNGKYGLVIKCLNLVNNETCCVKILSKIYKS